MADDLPQAVGFNASSVQDVAKSLRELHAYVSRLPLIELHEVSGLLRFPLFISPRGVVPRWVAFNARNNPDNSQTVEALGGYWYWVPSQRLLRIDSINNLSSGTNYTIDVLIVGERA